MNVLVTGVAGAIGSHVAEALARAKHDVVGIDAFTDYYHPGIKHINANDVALSGVRVIDADLMVAPMESLLEDIEVIYHFAAQPGISSKTPFSDYVAHNILATQRLIEAAKRSPSLKLFVHASTSSVYGSLASSAEDEEARPVSYYGVTKLAAEQLTLAAYREEKFPAVVLRLFSVYGPRERPEKLYHSVIRETELGKPVTLFEGSERHVRSYSYIDDIVRGNLLILEHHPKPVGHIFNLGNDRTITTGEGLSIIEKALGHALQFNRVPRRLGDQIETAANIAKARSLLGYEITVQPEEGLPEEVAWYRSRIAGRIA